ncbi:MAG: TonB-dependent receptor plug domain-containing protein [Ferruginibacter sp.]
MKRFFSLLLCGNILYAQAQENKHFNDTTLLQPVEINAVRAQDKTPFAKTNLGRAEIEKNNTGQDLPFILNQVPSVVVNSDAGNGIGYTNIRLRGSDASRLNVTLNGVPFNDAESQGTFFVDIPDIAASAAGIQVQRGVGTSTNGAGAFGGSINVNTNEVVLKKNLQLFSSAGSYSSFRNTLVFNSGLLGKHFTTDLRLSQLQSDGYIDRAESRLRSLYASASYISAKNSIRFNVITGKEKTYQAWNGVPESMLKKNRRFNSAGTERPGTPYENETDNYLQTHYQLFFNHQFTHKWKANLSSYLVRGKGYYEQYKAARDLADYGLPVQVNGSDTISSTDLVRQLWLDNYFYGNIFSAQYDNGKRQLIMGAGWNRYDGKHYGKINWTKDPVSIAAGYKWYNHSSKKTELSAYTKWTEKIGSHWQSFLDLQVRSVQYSINGFRDNPGLKLKNDYFFFNPKAGITFSKGNIQSYLSYARAAKEPNRDDFEAGKNEQPRAEYLNDMEAGVEQKKKQYNWAVNFYYMQYKNQLVLTGKINDVGAYTRTNIAKSYRMGVELTGAANFTKWFSASGNAAFSRNRIKDFTEYIDDYDNGGQKTNYYPETTIAFSPAIAGSASLNFFPAKGTELNLISKYVSRQYLDNTSKKDRSLQPYYTQDIKISYSFSKIKIKELKLFFNVCNVFSKHYEPNGYTFSYIYGGVQTTENYYFPMAPVNFMGGINVKL